MSHLSLSDVQTTNLYLLQTICLGLAKDRLAASRHFALTAAQADYLLHLSSDQIWSAVAAVGSTTLFPPRRDLVKLLQLPAPLVGPITAAHDPLSGRH